MFPLLILAAGASSRMRGDDKLAMTIDGVSLLRRQVIAGIAAGARVHVALRPDDPRAALLDGLDVARFEIAASAEGMGGISTRAAVEASGAPAPLLFILNS